MIKKNRQILKKPETEVREGEGKSGYEHAIESYGSTWDEALQQGALPSRDPMEGIEVDIKIASVVNPCLKKSSRESLNVY
jgi:hypothetical protein